MNLITLKLGLIVILAPCIHGVKYQGSAILQDLTEVALRLMTPTGTSFDWTKRNFLKSQKYNPDGSSLFDVFPEFVGAVKSDSNLNFMGSCWQDITAKSEMNGETFEVKIDLKESNSWLCTEAIIIATDTQYFVKDFLIGGEHVITFDTPTTEAQEWDLYQRGPRIFLFRQGLAAAASNLASTIYLFEPCLTEGVMETFAEANLNFLRDYAGIEMPKRPEGVPEILPIDKNLVQNGDTFDIMRLDGLDPMIAFAMGAATGHTAIALWKEKELYLCESNAKSPYWPINGIQCNTYEDWMEQGRKNGYNVVWAPLDRQLVSVFNATSAWNFVNDHLGIDYGWEVVLMGLLDTPHGNEICVDSQKKNCIIAEHFELIFSIAEKYSKDAARVFVPAILQRGNVDFNQPIVEAYFRAFKDKKIEPKDLHLVPENDDWQYPTTRNGEDYTSDVSICNVFTCKVLRASGIFGSVGDEINCGEFSVNDNYRLQIYQKDFQRPDICVQWDPENPLCQVLGKYQLRLDSQPGVLPRYNYVPIHPGFGDSCPAQAPDYLAPIDC